MGEAEGRCDKADGVGLGSPPGDLHLLLSEEEPLKVLVSALS